MGKMHMDYFKKNIAEFLLKTQMNEICTLICIYRSLNNNEHTSIWKYII